MKKLLAVALLVLSFGCATLHDEMAGWMNHTREELVAAWGPPLSVSDDGQGGQILRYYRGGYSSARIWVYTRKNGIIYYWRTLE